VTCVPPSRGFFHAQPHPACPFHPFILPAAYFVLLGMLAIVACIDPQLAPLFPRHWSEHEFKLRLPRIPLVLKVGRWLCELKYVSVCTWGWSGGGKGGGGGGGGGCHRPAAPLLSALCC
jgi:hypothetical protein